MKWMLTVRPETLVLAFFVLLPFLQSSGAQEPTPLFGEPESRSTTLEDPVAAPSTAGAGGFAEYEAALVAWPDSKVQPYLQAILGMGPSAVPHLMRLLDSNDWRVRAAAVHLLGELDVKAAFERIRVGLGDVSNLIGVETWCRVLVRLDPVEGVRVILPWLSSTSNRGAAAAFDAMPPVLDESFRDALIPLLEGREDELRRRAFVLLERVKGVDLEALAAEYLDDRSSKIASRSARILADSMRPEINDELNRAAREGTLRRACYATLALVMREDSTRKPCIASGQPLLDRWMKWLAIRGDFENAVGALALAHVSLTSNDERVRELADKTLAPRLIGAAWGGRIFADYSSVKDLCERKLEEITGESFGDRGDTWKRWWVDNSSTFVAQRRLTDLQSLDPTKVRLDDRKSIDQGHSTQMTIVASSAVAALGAPSVYLVDVAVMKSLLERLQVSGFLDLAPSRTKESDVRSLALTAGKFKFTRSFPVALPGALEWFEEEAARIVEQNSWQVLKPIGDPANAERWIREKATQLAGMTSAERDAAIAEMSLDALSRLDAASLERAVASFEGLPPSWVDAHREKLTAALRLRSLGAKEAVTIARLLRLATPPAPAIDLVQVLMARGDEFAEAALPLLGECSIDELLSSTKGAKGSIEYGLMRELARRLPHAGAAGALIELVRAPAGQKLDVFCKVTAGADVGVLILMLEAIAKDEGDVARTRAVEALVAITADADLDAVVQRQVLASEPVRRAALRGLNRRPAGRASEVLLRLLETTEDELAYFDVLSAIAAREALDVRSGLEAWLANETRNERIVAALPTVTSVFGADSDRILGRFLESDSADLRHRTALLLGAKGRTEAIPILIDMLTDRGLHPLARETLEQLTCLAPVEREPAVVQASYRSFMEAHGGESADAWFVTALKGLGVPTIDIESALAQGTLSARSADALIEILDSEKWYLRVHANRILRTLSGRDFGNVTSRTRREDLERLIGKWKEWRGATHR